MVKKRYTLLAGLISLVLLISGCAAGPSVSQDPTTAAGQVKSLDLMANVQATPWSGTPDVSEQKLLDGIGRFSLELLQESVQNEGNVMISPASVFLALAMTVNGAAGETRDAMLWVLAEQGITVDEINRLSRDWIALLEKSEAKTVLNIANSIWFRDGFVPRQAFLQNNADYYQAGARSLDFAATEAPDIINGWVSDSTNGLIDKMIEKINPATVMFLINTIYFKAEWEKPFIKENTSRQSFQAPNGPVETDFMHKTDPMRYFESNDARGVALPYVNGQFAFFAILPDNENPRAWLARQDAESLFGQLESLATQDAITTVSLALPRFEAACEDSLVNELTAMGMGIAFNSGQADFSLLSDEQGKGLYIDDVKHKTKISVDENGTEAAAATVVVIAKGVLISEAELVFDKPFLYGILDLETKLPLFIGILENPSGN